MRSDPLMAPEIGAPARVGSRMLQLREATRSAHDRITGVLPLFAPGLTTRRYVTVLQALHGFYVPLEPLCHRGAGASCAALDLGARVKAQLLASDLTALGRTKADIVALPVCQDLPAVTDASQAMGVLYVLEGATLGGQSIRRQLLQSLDGDALFGLSFFTGYGPSTDAMWRQFGAHVEAADWLELDAAIGAARATFQTLERWMAASLAAH